MREQLLLHFIRKLIQRLFNQILFSSCTFPQLEDERRRGEAGGVGRASVHFTLFWLTSVQSSSVPQPVGYMCLSSVFFPCVSITACQLGCLSHQRDLHLFCFVALLLLSAGVLFGGRRSSSHRS